MPATLKASPIFIRASQVQEVFGIHRSTLYRMEKRGQIAIHKRGSQSFVRVADMERFITGMGDQMGVQNA